MADIRELRTKFTADAKGIKRVFQDLAQEASNFGRVAGDTTQEVNQGYSQLEESTKKLKRALQDAGDIDAFEELNSSAEAAQREIEQTGRVTDETMERLQRSVDGSAEHFNALGDDARQSFSQVEEAIGGVVSDLSRLGSSAAGGLGDVSDAANGARSDLDRAGDAAGDLDSELRDLGSDTGLSDLTDDVGGLEGAMGKLGGSGGAILGVAGALGAAATGLLGFVAAGAGIYGLVKSGDAYQKTLNNLQVATGSSTDEMHGMRNVLKDIYANNFGESFDDIGESMTFVEQITNSSGKELQKLTEYSLLLRDSFQYEVAESTRAASTLMKRFGVDGTEAYALIAEGSQKGLNYADDFLDTINEYSVYYEAAGFSAQEMFGMFQNAKENGTFNLDYAADAFKEFGIIMTEDSDRASDALGQLGLDGKELRKQFSLGGDDAKEAFQTIANALGEVKDPMDQNIIGVELFGTKFEDMGAAAVIEMSKANDSIKGTKDVLDSMNEIKYNTIGESITGVGRLVVANLLLPLQDRIMPFLNNAVNKMVGYVTVFKDVMAGLKGGESASSIIESYGLSADGFMPAINAAKLIHEALSRIYEIAGPLWTKIKAVFALFQDQDGTAISLLHKLGMSPEEIQPIMDSVQRIQDRIEGIADSFIPVRKAVEAIFAFFNNQAGTGISILHEMGMKPEEIQMFMDGVDVVKGLVTSLVDGVKVAATNLMDNWDKATSFLYTAFQVIWPKIQPLLASILSFAVGIIKKISDFWASDGAVMAEAVGNIFKGIMAVIAFVMPAVLGIIKMVWNNIQGVINGALNVIMGAVKIFSGLFTGDFKKMWEGLVQMFKGAVEFIWNFVQLTFFGKILSGAKAFVLTFRTFFVSLWQGIISLFKGNVQAAQIIFSTAWQTIYRSTSTIFKAIWTFLKNTLASVKSIFTGFISGAKAIFSAGLQFILRTTQTNFTGILTFIKGILTTIRTFISTSVTGILTKVKDTWLALKSSTSSTFRDIYNGIKTKFTDIVELAKKLPGRIGDGIGAMASKVTTGVTKVINKMASVLGKGVNGVIGGINWVLGKIGVDEKNYIDKWTVPQYAKGTKGNGGHPGGLMVVGDGKGSNSGQELIETPDGRQMLSPKKPTLTEAPEGTKVWSATETRKIMDMVPHYAWGDIKDGVRAAGEWATDNVIDPAKSLGSKAVSGVKKVGSKVKDVAISAYDYVKNPGGLLDIALKALGIEKPSSEGFSGKMAVGGWNKVKAGAVDYVKGKLNDFAATSSGISVTGGNGGGFGAPFRLTSRPGPRDTGIPGASRMHMGWDWAAPTGTPIPSVSDGVVSRNSWHPLSGNFVEVRSGTKTHRYQHNSRNLVSVGQSVKKGQTVGLVGMTGVGSGPHLHYELKGYEQGAIVGNEQVARVAEGGKKEAIIPLEQHRTRALGLYKEAGKALGVSDTEMTLMYNEQKDVLAYLKSILTNVVEVVRSNESIGVKVGQLVAVTTTKLEMGGMNGTRSALMSAGLSLKGTLGGLGDMSNTAWLKEGGFAETIISHDPSKKLSQRAIWEQTGRELGFDDGTEKFGEIVDLLQDIANGVNRGQNLQVLMDERLVGQLVTPHVNEANRILDGRKDVFKRKG